MDTAAEPRRSRRRPARAAYAGVAVIVGLMASGCGAVAHMSAGDGHPAKGKPLFKTHCASCHTLAAADAVGVVGPNLDSTFGIVRAQGFDVSTIRDVVRGQIAYPETKIATGGTGMPADLVTGQDARDVADFVAECAKLPTQDAEDTGLVDPGPSSPDACK